MGVDQAVVFPNFGLLERRLDADLGSLTANIRRGTAGVRRW